MLMNYIRFIHKTEKSYFWCIDYNKYEAYYCLNQGTKFWRTLTPIYANKEDWSLKKKWTTTARGASVTDNIKKNTPVKNQNTQAVSE